MPSFVQVADGLAIMQEVERIQRGERRGSNGRIDVEVHWRELTPWAIEKQHVTIVPLARSDGSADADAQLGALAQSLLRDFVHFFGGDDFHAESPLDPDDGYGRRLGRQNLVSFPRYVWRVRDYAVTIVREVDPQAADASTLALHVFPAAWRFAVPTNSETKRAASRRRTMAKQMDAADLDWTWPEDADG
ncbi:hypothetical protein [Microbacterium sp. NPDC090003]|uniref:hypothetical protein n=1 Tax=Microbacterium sp. NPDC090003 TaxID=3364203 RepID=UPI00382877F7